ncbi:MAG TPA: hypothetical protein VGG02_04970 [Chthoniobacterales bacterium]|jgi:hypothetical protein
MRNHLTQSGKNIAALLGVLLLAFGLSQSAHATGNQGIVGLWNVKYFQGTTELFETYDQWHSDGLEFEVNSIAPGAVCQGTYKQSAKGMVHLYHVIYTFDSNGVFNGRILETQTNTVSADGTTYTGTFDQKVYDLNGNLLADVTGTLTATRVTVHG